MSDVPADTRPLVVHVQPDRPLRAGSIGPYEWLAAFEANRQCVVERFGDVYRALARLGRDRDHPPTAILVCLDDLTRAEEQFFDLASRLCRHTAIAVYGSRTARGRRAAELGFPLVDSRDDLRGWLERALQSELGGSTALPSQSSSAPTGEERGIAEESANEQEPESNSASSETDEGPHTREAPLISPIEHASGDASPPLVVADDDGEEVDDEERDVSDEASAPPTNTVRVPWLRYEDGPQRSSPPPTRRADRTGRPAPAADSVSRRSYEPLLTDDELRALIGDDLGSLGPERTPTDRDDSKREEGSG